MKKLLVVLLVLMISVGFVFAADPKSITLSAEVKPGNGSITDPSLDPDISGIGFGFFITNKVANSTDFAVANQIKDETLDIDLTRNVRKSYVLWYYGKEVPGSSHIVTISATDWVMKENPGVNQKVVANTPTVSGFDAANNNNNVASVAAPSDKGVGVTVTFGTDGKGPVVNTTPVNVGTFDIEWTGGGSSLEVGNYQTTITFTLSDV